MAILTNSQRAKKSVTEQGGKITTEFKLIKGFTYVLALHNLVLVT
jgi:hypothetical protein